MARKPRAPFDPSKLSDRPGSITPAQFAILTRLGTLLPTRKQQGKMYRVTDLSQREASLLLGQVSASRGEARATAAQIKYLYALGAMFPDDITKAEASALIQQMKSHAIPNNGARIAAIDWFNGTTGMAQSARKAKITGWPAIQAAERGEGKLKYSAPGGGVRAITPLEGKVLMFETGGSFRVYLVPKRTNAVIG